MEEYKARKRVNLIYAIILLFIYLISFILLNVGFYAPKWYKHFVQVGDRDCSEVGLVSGKCRYPYTEMDKTVGEAGFVMRAIFYMVLTAMCFLYMSFLTLGFGIAFSLLENPVYMSFSSIIMGILYPVAGILTVTTSIYLRINGNVSDPGYAPFLTTTGGILILISYYMLRVHEMVMDIALKFLDIGNGDEEF
ncbi:uncharacterized protein LOC132741164 [Ruditapes philippinarum]|uniref:uncharacterized protein LOC132741164 n=1 Tax=Ruditapes philippinarum TaxID=129788 RepID=UPI00295A9C9C|nr:uncharacterized protein LOC132741164 [Ruditapes philippinarum]